MSTLKERKALYSYTRKNIMRDEVIEHYGDTCTFCHTTKNLTIHHRDFKPRGPSRGSRNRWQDYYNTKNSNPTLLIRLCKACHGHQHHIYNKHNLITLFPQENEYHCDLCFNTQAPVYYQNPSDNATFCTIQCVKIFYHLREKLMEESK